MKLNEKKIIDLNNLLLKYSKEYYTNNKSSISDSEYDGLYIEYSNLIKKYPNFEPKNSILKIVGSKIDNRFKKENHQFKMLSLDNAFNEDDLIKFNKRIQEQLNFSKNFQYMVEPKIDGLSISIIYKNGKLIKGITRGDGLIGENVTHNILEIKDIPKEINYQKKIEFRGEIYMPLSVFKKLNNKRLSHFANPRNAASGTLRQLNSQIVKKRNLKSFIYSIPNSLDHNLQTQENVINFINKMGFSTTNIYKKFNNIKSSLSHIKEIENIRSNLDYEIDGIVFKINDVNLYEDIGQTSKFPKYMIAYKFPETVVSTKLIDIFGTVGRTGRITYNAKLSPVILGGTKVSAATLHNADYIKEIDVNIGDIVNIKKAGEIIPKVLSLKTKNNKNSWKELEFCPSCNSKLNRIYEEVDQYCINNKCNDKMLANLVNFVSKNAMNIEGLSTEIIKTFLKEEIINYSFSSIMEIPFKKNEILKLKFFKEKSINNLINSINKSKHVKLDKFIFSLGIRHIGSKNSKILAKKIKTLNGIISCSSEEIEQIRDLGTKAAKSITEYFNKKDNLIEIKKIQNLGLKIESISNISSNILLNLTFVITGTLSKSRNYFKNLIEKNSGNVTNAISKNTSYLLVGTNPGSKIKKAKEKDVKIINEKDFLKMIKEWYE